MVGKISKSSCMKGKNLKAINLNGVPHLCNGDCTIALSINNVTGTIFTCMYSTCLT